MRRAPGVHFNAENYSLLISAIAERGFFRDDSAPIDGATDIGYHPAMGSQLLSALVSEMAEDVLEITSYCASRMRMAFIQGFGLNIDDEAKEQLNAVPKADTLSLPHPAMGSQLLSALVSEMAEDVLEITSYCASRMRMAFIQGFGLNIDDEAKEQLNAVPKADTLSLPEDLVVDRVYVDNETAICPRTNATLRLITLDKAQRSQLHDTLEEMANSQYAEYDEKLKQRKQVVDVKDEDYAAKQLRNFAEWIE